MDNRNQRTMFLTSLSGIAILMVIFNHLRAFFYQRTYLQAEGAIYDFTLLSKPDQILDILIDFPVAIFIFISGFKFASNLKRYFSNGSFQAKSFYLSRLKKLLIPYLIWSVFYLLLGSLLNLIKVTLGMEVPETLFTKEHWIGFLTGVNNYAYQLWFLPLLIFTSFVVVTIKFVLKQLWLLHALYFGYYLLLAFARGWLELVFPLGLWLQFLIVYDMGLIFGKKYQNENRPPRLWYIGLLWLVIIGFRMINLRSDLDVLFKAALQPLTPLFLYYLVSITQFLKTSRLLVLLGDYSWQIYLLHAPILTNLLNSLSERFGLVSPWFDFLKSAIIISICVGVIKLLYAKFPRLTKIIF